MRAKRLLKGLAIALLIICAVILGIDVFKNIKINVDYMQMQESSRISSSSRAPEVRYAPTDLVISNKEDVLTEIKEMTIELKTEYINSTNKKELFEIGNIHKIKNLFLDYQSYAIVKYKLLNIIEDLPNLYKETIGYNDAQLENYFNKNSTNIESCYGISENEDFINLAKSITFLENQKIKAVTLKTSSINFDYDNENLSFSIVIETINGEEEYFVNVDYYKSNVNQIKPYLKITK